MKEHLSISCTPFAEDCEQLGRNYRPEIAYAECKAFMNQIKRVCGEPPFGARLKIVSNAHDFGTYYEVDVVYDDNSEKAVEYAFSAESHNDLEYWDDLARAELLAIPDYPVDRVCHDDVNFDQCSHSDTT